MVAPAPEEGSDAGKATPLPSEESDSGKLYEAMQDDTTISQGNIEIAVRHLRHLQVNVSDAISSDIDSMMRSAKCTTLNF